LAVTVSDPGAEPASGATPIQEGAAEPAVPASTDTANFTAVVPEPTMDTVWDGAELPPEIAENARAVGDTESEPLFVWMVPEPVSVNG
jgi:hypothetical protein